MTTIVHFIVGTAEREQREVSDTWAHKAWARNYEVLLGDGVQYKIVDVKSMPKQHRQKHLAVHLLSTGEKPA